MTIVFIRPITLTNHKTFAISGVYIYRKDYFSNPRFFETPDNSNQKSFPFLSQTLRPYPWFIELPDFSNQILFPLEVREIGIPLYCETQ